MKLKKLLGQTRLLSLKFDGGELNVRYYPNRYTPEHEEAASAIMSGSSAGAMFKAMLVPLISSWDLEDEFERVKVKGDYKPSQTADLIVYDVNKTSLVEVYSSDNYGQRAEDEIELTTVPVTALGMHKVPLYLLMRISREINKDLDPERASEEENSSSGSF